MSSNPDPRRFAETLLERQAVVEQLELGNLPLEEAVRLFERGTELADACRKALDAAELRVTRLAGQTATPLSDMAATEQ